MYDLEQIALSLPRGFHPPQAVVVEFYNNVAQARSVGDVVTIDVLNSGAATTDPSYELTDFSVWSTGLLCSGTQIDDGNVWGVCLDDIPANGKGRIQVAPIMKTNIVNTSGGAASIAVGDKLAFYNAPNAKLRNTAAAPSNNRFAGIAVEAGASISGGGTWQLNVVPFWVMGRQVTLP